MESKEFYDLIEEFNRLGLNQTEAEKIVNPLTQEEILELLAKAQQAESIDHIESYLPESYRKDQLRKIGMHVNEHGI